MARQSGCTMVTICDVDAGRVDYALDKGFATHGYVVPGPLPSSSVTSGTCTPSDGAMTPLSTYDGGMAHRLDAAKALAADILAISRAEPLDGDDEEDQGVDVAFECTGKESCMQTALYATRPGGKLVMVGMGTPIQTVPLSAAHLREVDILGVFRYANTYPTGIRLLAGNGYMKLPSLDDIVTHKFKGLERAQEAFELAGRTADDDGRLVLKVVIEG
jgi:L-iditol 2-dehydrogenase